MSEKRGGLGNGRRDKDFAGLLDLTDVTGADEPHNVGNDVGPPEAIQDGVARRIKSLVTYFIMNHSENV